MALILGFGTLAALAPRSFGFECLSVSGNSEKKDPGRLFMGDPLLTPTTVIAGKTCHVFNGWPELFSCLKGEVSCGVEIPNGTHVLLYQGAHGGRGGLASCNAGDYPGDKLFEDLAGLSTKFRLGYVSASCFSTDLQAKRIRWEAAHPDSKTIDRLCMVTASPFGAMADNDPLPSFMVSKAKVGRTMQQLFVEDAPKDLNFVLSSTPWESLGIGPYLNSATAENAKPLLERLNRFASASDSELGKKWKKLITSCGTEDELQAWMASDTSTQTFISLTQAEGWIRGLKQDITPEEWSQAVFLSQTGDAKLKLTREQEAEWVAQKVNDPNYTNYLKQYPLCIDGVKAGLAGLKNRVTTQGRRLLAFREVTGMIAGTLILVLGKTKTIWVGSGRGGSKLTVPDGPSCSEVFHWFGIKPDFLPSVKAHDWEAHLRLRSARQRLVQSFQTHGSARKIAGAEVAAPGSPATPCEAMAKEIIDQFLGLSLSPYQYDAFDGKSHHPISQSFNQVSALMYGFSRDAIRTDSYANSLDLRRRTACEKFRFKSIAMPKSP